MNGVGLFHWGVYGMIDGDEMGILVSRQANTPLGIRSQELKLQRHGRACGVA